MAQSFFALPSPIEVVASGMPNPSDFGIWKELNLQALAGIPAGATGIIFHVEHYAAGADTAFGIRKTGSTDNRTNWLNRNTHQWGMCGVNAAGHLDVFIKYQHRALLHITGYTTAGVTFLTNGIDISPGVGVTWAWTLRDISAQAPGAIGLIIEITTGGWGPDRAAGYRMNGASDDRTEMVWNRAWAVIGCDASQRVQLYKGGNNTQFFLVGYITDGVAFYTNAIDKSLSAPWGTWQTIYTVLDAGLAFIEGRTTGGAGKSWGLRKDAGIGDIHRAMAMHYFGIIETDASRNIEGLAGGNEVDFFLVGRAIRIVAPTTSTDPETLVTATSATLNGTLDNDGGEACDCGFEWGETIAYGDTTPTESKVTGQTFSQGISGLTPGMTYHFRAFAINSEGTSYGTDRTFIAQVAMPTVTTDPATAIGTGTANLNGTLDDDGGEACECGFEWGETTAYGNTTPPQSKVTGQTFSQGISGLTPGMTYHFRTFATNAAGTNYGADRAFTTTVTTPTVTTDPATGISTLKGTLVDDGGEVCACGFQWGLTGAYGNTTPTQSRTSGQTFQQTIGDLAHSTTYHFRAFATNAAGTSYGADRTFATPGSLPMVTTNPETGLGMARAVFNGTLNNDGGEVCACGFEWGFDTGYGITTPPESKVTGETFDEIISGLFPNTTYHFRAWATNSDGTGYGADRAFTTKPAFSKAYALAREEV